MRAFTWFAALIAAALLGGAPVARAQAPAAPAIVAEESGGEAAVGAALSDTNRMLVAVTIGGTGPYQFIVDTAAERSVVANDLAQALGLQPARRARLLSITSAREMTLVRMPEVSFIAGQTRDLEAFALRREHLGAAGILGIDALRGQRVVLDFDALEMRVGEAPGRAQRITRDDIIVRGRTRYGQLVLADADVNGTPVDVVVDSGLQVSVGNTALRRLLANRRRGFQLIEVVSITGESFEADYTTVDDLRIGGVAISGLPVAFGEPYFFRRVRLTRRPALLLGMDALRAFRLVAVDFPNRRAHFVLRREGEG